MKIINKFFLLGVGVLLTLGVVSCNNEKEPNTSQEKEAKTYMALSLNMPMGSFRANADGQDEDEPKFNYVGKWAGKDVIEKVAIYMVPADNSGSVEKLDDLNYSEYYNDPTPSGDNKIVLTPKKGVKVTTLVGKEVVVYVLLNASEKATEILNNATAVNFKEEYKKVIELSSQEDAVAEKNQNKKTAAGKIAEKKGDSEKIMMTCLEPSKKIKLEQYVSEQDALSGYKNQAEVSVERTVARVMVSVEKKTFTIKDEKGKGQDLGTLSDIRYVVAQGERKVFISKNNGDNTNTWKTPGSAFVPDASTFHTDATQWYDYVGLWEDYKEDGISGTELATIKDYQTTDKNKAITEELEKSLSGKFLLPNTHKFGVKGVSQYKKGNTAYILIRAKFTPKVEIFADKGKQYSDGEMVKDYNPGDDFYVGTNGKFYVNMKSVRDPKVGGVKGMNANRYVKGKVLYFAWLNPDKANDKEWLNSPVVRNNIYHVHISGFKSIGVNWNPLVPDKDPNPENPNNPDPNPNEPGHDPKDNPIKPEDPLSNDDTYMSVQVTVLPWLVHSYSIELGF
ncbi:fimbrial protein [Porphyromonas macacae]|uniref:Mfa1 family fimbria major subunit n=1 Tax=Porphyromonas macacae TaxID=28115 RepID=UPI00052DBE0F|nr:Mfa1 family fimbria major subunit [Porphyromonas macacae]KGN99572.1 fimbrial protein [Porphyromonas macacae]